MGGPHGASRYPRTTGERVRHVALFLLLALPSVTCAETAYLALVIDDLGHSRHEIRAVLDLPGPVSGAVLPHAPHSQATAEEFFRHGRDVLLHLPMEPIEPRAAGPGALVRGMTPREIAITVDYDLTTVPHAVGINNHMGSLLTQDRESMQVLMRHLGRQGDLFFLDSLTSAQSVAHVVAQEHAVPVLVRDVFLDSDRSIEAIRGQLARAVVKAQRLGSAIAIGHPYPETLSVLQQQLPMLRAEGVELVSISDLLARKTVRAASPRHENTDQPVIHP